MDTSNEKPLTERERLKMKQVGEFEAEPKPHEEAGSRKESSPPMGARWQFLIGPQTDFWATFSSDTIGASSTRPAAASRNPLYVSRRRPLAVHEHDAPPRSASTRRCRARGSCWCRLEMRRRRGPLEPSRRPRGPRRAEALLDGPPLDAGPAFLNELPALGAKLQADWLPLI